MGLRDGESADQGIARSGVANLNFFGLKRGTEIGLTLVRDSEYLNAVHK